MSTTRLQLTLVSDFQLVYALFCGGDLVNINLFAEIRYTIYTFSLRCNLQKNFVVLAFGTQENRTPENIIGPG
ncbi:hypothetical protein D5086_006581 [Populus alba]|uniref:Uncharacterized protein n=1 Tax=Populus alba TaxID=43335 RepID=A0ACC4CL42_POPAL